MKVSGDLKEITCTQLQLAQAFGLSPARVSQLINEKVVVRDETSRNGQVMLFESVKNFYLYRNTGGESAEVSYNVERALYMKAKRELAQLKLDKARGNLYDAKTVESAFVNVLTVMRTNLLNLPAKLALQLENQSTDVIFDVLTTEIEFYLGTLSEIDLSTLTNGGADDDEEC